MRYYYEPNKPRRVHQFGLRYTAQQQQAGRCNHCRAWNDLCKDCRQETKQ